MAGKIRVFVAVCLTGGVLACHTARADGVLLDDETLATLKTVSARIKARCESYGNRLTVEADAVQSGKGSAVRLRDLDEQVRGCMDMLGYIALIDLAALGQAQ